MSDYFIPLELVAGLDDGGGDLVGNRGSVARLQGRPHPRQLLGAHELRGDRDLLNLVGQMAYLLTGLALVRAPRGAYTALGAAPVYIVWKIGLYAQAMLSNRAGAWVRTARVASDVQR